MLKLWLSKPLAAVEKQGTIQLPVWNQKTTRAKWTPVIPYDDSEQKRLLLN